MATSNAIPPAISQTGTKRKREPEPKFYSVRNGHRPGVYHKWVDCLAQVKGYKNAIFKSFPSLADAETFLSGHDPTPNGHSTASGAKKFYAVRNGRVPGVYTDWPSAQEQITGWPKPKHHSFPSRNQAEAYVLGLDGPGTEKSADTEVPKRGKEKAPSAKKQKKTAAAGRKPSEGIISDVSYEPGMGPLPPDSEDGFDPSLILDPITGDVRYKTEAERRRTIPKPSGPNNSNVLRIHTDGSSLGNGVAGAVAGVGVFFGRDDKRNVSEALSGSRQTNQRAELTAILRALEIAPRHREVVILTDSSYSINCVTVWSANWIKNGWKSSTGKAVENRDLIEDILLKIDERESLGVPTRFEWLKGHASHAGNVEADRLAVAGARNAKRGVS
ncbi:MAG: hypothetical protein M1825_001890 [Sarcosagium campestre]|nr:MAG: hypothetical protein M1825_001890 [Sarcosagium campestre]